MAKYHTVTPYSDVMPICLCHLQLSIYHLDNYSETDCNSCNYQVLMYVLSHITHVHTYIYNWFCYTCVDLMPKLERIQQVMMNVARKAKEVRMKYLCK